VIRDSGLANRALRASGQATLADLRDRYDEYDVIILGSCEEDFASEDLYRFVTERGGGLLLLPGKTVESLATQGHERASATLPVLFGDGAWRERTPLSRGHPARACRKASRLRSRAKGPQ
jgi:hypothetical protein